MRRHLVVIAVVVASFAASAAAVAYFADTEQTYDVVQAGPPIPWLKLWSQGSDPVNLDAGIQNNLTYATRNNAGNNPPAAATGKIDGPVETLSTHLGFRSNGDVTWKPTPGSTPLPDVHNRFNRLFTVEVPANAPLNAGQTVTLTLAQDNALPQLSSGNLMFAAMEFAEIIPAANTELLATFRGLNPQASVQLAPGQKRQVNVSMNQFGQTDGQGADRSVDTAIVVVLTTPDGGEARYRVPVLACNHVQQC